MVNFKFKKKTLDAKDKLRKARSKDDIRKIKEFLTLNMANVRGIELISRSFLLKHKDFEGDK